MAETDNSVQVEVAYALPGQAHVISLSVMPGTTISDAIRQSGILQRCPEIDLAKNMVGVFSKIRQLDTRLEGGERIEIYRTLLIDPRQARRQRAQKQKAENN